MQEALGQALGYARTQAEPPVFVIACDIGHCFELLACFDGSGVWRPFPSSTKPGATNRIYLQDLRDEEKLARLAAALKDPRSLDPSLAQVEITKQVVEKIAILARELRETHDKETVARFLLRCIFTMFAEDVGLFEGKKKIFEQYLRDYWIKSPASFPNGASVLWQTMDKGGSLMTGERVHRFNGGLFRDHRALPMTKDQLEVLREAASRDWSQVEPAIFGTLLENALGDDERHALGAHFTPRAYVERLVRPTIDEPLRAEWADVRFKVRTLMRDGDAKGEKAALVALKAFHARLCKIRVLDPACGTGNFLYVALDLMKQLEAEVLEEIRRIGGSGQELLELDTVTVSPRSFLGIEKNAWAKEIAELVLWIGYLRWQWRLRGTTDIAKTSESILRDEKNIECRDAVLDWDGAPRERLKLDDRGRPVTRWDGKTMKVDPITGLDVPDERFQAPVYEYPNPRRAEWPQADFIVGNPPFLGKLHLLRELGEGYVAALREVYSSAVPDGADFVMHWWYRAAETVAAGGATRFGLITTKSITQPMNRRIVAAALSSELPISLLAATPNHPWVDSADGAAVRIAMTIGARGRQIHGVLSEVTEELSSHTEIPQVAYAERTGLILPDLRIGADVASAKPLSANDGLAATGFLLGNRGFVLTRAQMDAVIEANPEVRELIFELRNGDDVTDRPRGLHVIDPTELSEGDLRSAYPEAYQLLRTTVFPARQQNRDPRLRREWWKFRRSNDKLRRALRGLRSFLVTSETAKHRVFVRMSSAVRPEHKLVVVAVEEPWVHAVLMSRVHVAWALAAGGNLGVGDDPVYAKTRCFDPFPFPDVSGKRRALLGARADAIEALRIRQLSLHPKLGITRIYNVLVKLRNGEALDEKDRRIHDQGLLTILRELHDELDAAVLEAYGWPADLSDEEILERLVALNAERAVEEARGLIRYLRPDFQAPKTEVVTQPPLHLGEDDTEQEQPSVPPPKPIAATRTWPKEQFAHGNVVRELIESLPEDARFDAAALDAHFKGKSKNRIAEIATSLQTWAALGELVTLAPGYYARPIRRSA